MRQAIIWTNSDRIHWRIYAALEGDKSIQGIDVQSLCCVYSGHSSAMKYLSRTYFLQWMSDGKTYLICPCTEKINLHPTQILHT